MIKISISGDSSEATKDAFTSLVRQAMTTFLEANPKESLKLNMRKPRSKEPIKVEN